MWISIILCWTPCSYLLKSLTKVKPFFLCIVKYFCGCCAQPPTSNYLFYFSFLISCYFLLCIFYIYFSLSLFRCCCAPYSNFNGSYIKIMQIPICDAKKMKVSKRYLIEYSISICRRQFASDNNKIIIITANFSTSPSPISNHLIKCPVYGFVVSHFSCLFLSIAITSAVFETHGRSKKKT